MEGESQQESTPHSHLESRGYFESPIHLIQYSMGKRKPSELEPDMHSTTISKIAELNNEDGLTVDNDDSNLYDVFGNPIMPVLSEFLVYNSERTPSE